MNPSAIKASKIMIFKMDVAMKDIHRICTSVSSEYLVAKRKLSDAHSLLYKDTKKAYKLILKARDDVVEESKAAQEYNRYREILPQIEDSTVSELNAKYLNSLKSGDYKKARETAIKLAQCEVVKGSGHSIDIKIGVYSEKLLFNVTNLSCDDICIKRFIVTAAGGQLSSDTIYPFVIRHNSMIPVSFAYECVPDSVFLIVEYSEEGLVKHQSFDVALKVRKGVLSG